MMKYFINKLLAKYFGIAITRNVQITELRSVLLKLTPSGVVKELQRFGSQDDGGYLLLPDAISNNGKCISGGIDKNIDFELELAEKFNIQVNAFDASVAALPAKHKNIRFNKLFIGSLNTSNFVTLNSIIENYTDQSRLNILKLDIEGWEYPVLCHTDIKNLERFNQIIVELHGLHQLKYSGFAQFLNCILDKLLINHFLAHAVPNIYCKTSFIHGQYIPDVVELTFVKNEFRGYQNSSEKFINSDKDHGHREIMRRNELKNSFMYR